MRSLVVFLFLIWALSVQAGVEVKKPEGMEEPPAQIAVTPPRVELKIGKKPANASVRLMNLSDKPVSVVARVHHWDLDEDMKVRVIEPTPQSLDQWMIVNPVRFTIPPKKNQTVRFSIRPNVKPAPGEHRGIIYFTQQLPDDAPKAGVTVTFRLGVIVYGVTEPVVREGKLEKIVLEHKGRFLRLNFPVQSTGNAGIRLSGQYSLWRKSDFPGAEGVRDFILRGEGADHGKALQVGGLPNLPVLGGTKRTIRKVIELPDAQEPLVLLVRGKLGEEAFSRQFELQKQ